MGSQLIQPSNKATKSLAVFLMAVVVVVGGYMVAKSHAATNQLYLSPSSGNVIEGNNVDVAVRMDSGTDPVNAVQANLTYDPTKLQFVSISAAGSAFGLEAQSAGGAGTVSIARATSGGAAPVTGDQLVATVTFKALVSGTTADVAFGSGSAVVNSDTNSNILVSSAGATFDLVAAATPTPTLTPTPSPTATPSPTPSATPSSTPSAGSATMYLNPSSGSVTAGANLTFAIREDSGATGVNAVQADYNYSTTQFELVSIDSSTSDFGLQAVSTGANGQIRIARGTNPGSPPISGDKLVATVTLKALIAGSASVTPVASSAVVRASDAVNILTTKTGGTYTLVSAGMGSGGTPTPTPTPTATPAPVSVVGSKKAIPVKKTVKLTAPALPGTQVSYAVDGNAVDGGTIDTTKLEDGTHTITATTEDSTGKKASVSQKVAVTNKPVDTGVLAAARQAAPYLAGLVVLLLVGIGGATYYRRMNVGQPTLYTSAGQEPPPPSAVYLPENQPGSKE
jgi:hypothetical protein